MSTKFCKDCKWSSFERWDGVPGVYYCRKPIERGINLVTGEPVVQDSRLCAFFRSEIEPGCGPEGRYFEPKDTQ